MRTALVLGAGLDGNNLAVVQADGAKLPSIDPILAGLAEVSIVIGNADSGRLAASSAASSWSSVVPTLMLAMSWTVGTLTMGWAIGIDAVTGGTDAAWIKAVAVSSGCTAFRGSRLRD